MEYIEGETIDKYLISKPEDFLSVFRQTLNAFAHLEKCRILHRDIRYQNLLVRSDGTLKVIDLGFGKTVIGDDDFISSISLNWNAPPPPEFSESRYDFRTEVYFVGKIFERLIAECSLENEFIKGLVQQMCILSPSTRISSFAEVAKRLGEAGLTEPEFTDHNIEIYRSFANQLDAGVRDIHADATYITDVDALGVQLERLYRECMLESEIYSGRAARCLITGNFRGPGEIFDVFTLKQFLKMFKESTPDAKHIIIANLCGRLDNKPRYDDNEIPF